MGIFATLARRGAQAEVAPGVEPVEDAQHLLPARFEAVGEHLAAGRDASNACAMVGRDMARDGADLGEALDGLRTTYARVQGGEPDFRAVRALGVAWSEETLGYLHQLSCEDPLTGLASLAHLRARLSEVYRIAEQGGISTTTSHALVVLDLPLLARPSVWEDAFESTLRLARLAESARMAFPGRRDDLPGQPETVGRGRAAQRPAGQTGRVAALARAGRDTGERPGAGLGRGAAADRRRGSMLLDELARG